MQASIRNLKGIGPRKMTRFAQLGIKTMAGLANHLPRRHEDRRIITTIDQIEQADKYTLRLALTFLSSHRISGGRKLHKYIGSDQTGQIELLFVNAPYIERALKVGQSYFFYGAVKIERGKLSMFHPEFKDLDAGDFGIVPVYPLTDGLSHRDIVQAIEQIKMRIIKMTDMLPARIIDDNQLMARGQAVYQMHFPSDDHLLSQAIYRLKYEELFNMQMALLYAKNSVQSATKKHCYKPIDSAAAQHLFSFELTAGQRASIADIYADMDRPMPMNRLVQGDVGSGKTAVAIAAVWRAINSGLQAAFMVPTELLANQHYHTFCGYLDSTDIALLTAQTSRNEQMLAAIANGTYKLIIGTHAVIQEQVNFDNLCLVITDEQHRFGVNQRKALAEKSANDVDVLVMSATPIPRTLSMIMYGDMSISSITDMPKGRKLVKTHYIKPSKIDAMHRFIKERLSAGEQAYFVAPLIEESEKMDLKSAQELYAEISAVFKDFRVALIHGKLKNSEKDSIMTDFQSGIIHILVATTVIEVGVDVKRATIMVITHAERFGLAQLHQIRGRVGRGEGQSYCFLLSSHYGKIAKARIEMMTKTNNGFEIANKDLEIRGPGELLGVRQHGLPELKIADLSTDRAIIEKIQQDCKALIDCGQIPEAYDDWLNKHMFL